jgi:hypothetical protein
LIFLEGILILINHLDYGVLLSAFHGPMKLCKLATDWCVRKWNFIVELRYLAQCSKYFLGENLHLFFHPANSFNMYSFFFLRRQPDGEFQMNWSSFYFPSPKNFCATKISFFFCFSAKMYLVLKIDLSRVRIVIAMIHQKHFSNSGKFTALFFCLRGIFCYGSGGGKCIV